MCCVRLPDLLESSRTAQRSKSGPAAITLEATSRANSILIDMADTPPHPLSLDGRTVLVTGGNGGIGLGMASACAAAGAQIVIWGRKADKNAEAVARLESEGATAHAFVCDVANEDETIEMFARSVDAAGGKQHLLPRFGGVPWLICVLFRYRTPLIPVTHGYSPIGPATLIPTQ